MRASFALGLSVSMDTEDKYKNELECIIKGHKNPKLILKIGENIPNRWPEVPGFHITTSNRDSFDVCKEVQISIDKTVWHKVWEEYDKEFDGGFFMSRSPYDRIDITYWTKDKSYRTNKKIVE